MLPFPSLTSKTPGEQVTELLNYLIRFKETLEFILSNISADNLSPELQEKVNGLGIEAVESRTKQEEQMAQFAGKMLTVSDVVNSEAFWAALDREYRFTVNFDTGNLEYTKEM